MLGEAARGDANDANDALGLARVVRGDANPDSSAKSAGACAAFVSQRKVVRQTYWWRYF